MNKSNSADNISRVMEAAEALVMLSEASTYCDEKLMAAKALMDLSTKRLAPLVDTQAEYLLYHDEQMRSMVAASGGSLLNRNPNMRRTTNSMTGRSPAYMAYRTRNNQAARDSRDRKKVQDAANLIKRNFYDLKNEELKHEIVVALYEQYVFKNELSELKALLERFQK